jgi:hypothetical protein
MWNILLPSLMSLAGAGLTASINSQAATTAGNASIQGAQIQSDAVLKAAQLQAAGLARAERTVRETSERTEATLGQLRDAGAPGVAYLRNVIATPAELTASQRTAAELFKKVESDFTNTALDQNQRRADAAAGLFAGQAFDGTKLIANNQQNQGNIIAGLHSTEGKVAGDAAAKVGQLTGDATARAGLYDAQADLATGNVMGRAIGDVGAAIATEARASRYTDRLGRIERSLGIG